MTLKEKYNKEIVPYLKDKFNYKSIMQVPQLKKIVVNIGAGDLATNQKKMAKIVDELTLITGQKPIITKAKKSIAGFKLREDTNIGCKVTLRNQNMYDFLEKLVNICLPRIRDFRGINPNSLDGHGNFTLGIKEQIIFPEIEYDKVDRLRGMDIVFVTSAKTNPEAVELLTKLGIPFKKPNKEEENG